MSVVNLGYTMQDGDILYNPIIDRDNVSYRFPIASNQCLSGAVRRPREPNLFSMEMKMKTKMITTALTLSLAAGVAYADVPASQAARLGADLTPTGAEKAGSRSGVAAWTGRGN